MWFGRKQRTPSIWDREPLNGFTKKERQWLAPQLSEHSFEAGEVVVTEGTVADGFYLVLEGKLSASRTEAGRSHVVATFGPNDLVGELAAIDGGVRSDSVVADSKAKLMFVPVAALRGSAKSADSLASAVYNKLSLGLTATLARRVRSHLDASVKTSHQRVVLGEFTVNVLILVCLYVLLQNALPLFETRLPASTSAISLPLIALFGYAAVRFMRSTGYPLSDYGLGLKHFVGSLLESLVFSVPALGLATLLKAILIWGSEAPLIQHPDVMGRLAEPSIRLWLIVYVASSVVQELIVRSVLQSTLLGLLPGRSGALRAIVVCALLFSVSHLHISLAFAAAAFIPGVFWGFLYYRRRHLVGPALSHVLVGGYVFFILGLAL